MTGVPFVSMSQSSSRSFAFDILEGVLPLGDSVPLYKSMSSEPVDNAKSERVGERERDSEGEITRVREREMERGRVHIEKIRD